MVRRQRAMLISGLAKALEDSRGLELRAVALDGFRKKPWIVGGFPPDIIAYDPRQELLQLGDVLMPSDFSLSYIEKKLMAHSSLVMATGASKGERVPLHIATAVENEELLQELLQMLEIEAHVAVWTTGEALAS